MIFGVVGNKCDLFKEEKVSEEEGKNFAQQIGAIFKLTSCKEDIGIGDLFFECGQKYLEVNNLVSDNINKKNGGVQLKKLDESDKKKKGCC